jgi:hypothetical protein
MNGELQSSLLNELHEEFVGRRGLSSRFQPLKIGELPCQTYLSSTPGVISAISDALTKAGVTHDRNGYAHTEIVGYVKSADMDKA